ncbi:hypothetical protein L3Q82_009913 [Scortum barcoo]|uniref:Uncharacterized protein n=1 Tax=Scortum barcoo TaxID=214431 RepID=A0ACB8WEA5_9TELE|nr:hypothetical protein L3Q82_009913 [Scortum barcoo]
MKDTEDVPERLWLLPPLETSECPGRFTVQQLCTPNGASARQMHKTEKTPRSLPRSLARCKESNGRARLRGGVTGNRERSRQGGLKPAEIPLHTPVETLGFDPGIAALYFEGENAHFTDRGRDPEFKGGDLSRHHAARNFLTTPVRPQLAFHIFALFILSSRVYSPSNSLFLSPFFLAARPTVSPRPSRVYRSPPSCSPITVPRLAQSVDPFDMRQERASSHGKNHAQRCAVTRLRRACKQGRGGPAIAGPSLFHGPNGRLSSLPPAAAASEERERSGVVESSQCFTYPAATLRHESPVRGHTDSAPFSRQDNSDNSSNGALGAGKTLGRYDKGIDLDSFCHIPTISTIITITAEPPPPSIPPPPSLCAPDPRPPGMFAADCDGAVPAKLAHSLHLSINGGDARGAARLAGALSEKGGDGKEGGGGGSSGMKGGFTSGVNHESESCVVDGPFSSVVAGRDGEKDGRDELIVDRPEGRNEKGEEEVEGGGRPDLGTPRFPADPLAARAGTPNSLNLPCAGRLWANRAKTQGLEL